MAKNTAAQAQQNMLIEEARKIGLVIENPDALTVEDLKEMIANAEKELTVRERSDKEKRQLATDLANESKKSSVKIFRNVHDYSDDKDGSQPSAVDALALQNLTLKDLIKPENRDKLQKYLEDANSYYWAKIICVDQRWKNAKALHIGFANDLVEPIVETIFLEEDAYRPILSDNPKLQGKMGLPYRLCILAQVANMKYTSQYQEDLNIKMGSIDNQDKFISVHDLKDGRSNSFIIEIYEKMTPDDYMKYIDAEDSRNNITKGVVAPTCNIGYIDGDGLHSASELS